VASYGEHVDGRPQWMSDPAFAAAADAIHARLATLHAPEPNVTADIRRIQARLRRLSAENERLAARLNNAPAP